MMGLLAILNLKTLNQFAILQVQAAGHKEGRAVSENSSALMKNVHR